MLDWVYIAILLLALALIILQDRELKAQLKLIKRQGALLIQVEPILVAIVAAQEEAKKNKESNNVS